MLSIFSCASWPSVCLLWRNVYLGLLPIFLIGLFGFVFVVVFWQSCLSHSYILEINPLSFASFENIFSHSVGCLLILFMISFAVQKLLSLIRSHLFIFGFIFITLGGGSKQILLWLYQRVFCLCFPLRVLYYSALCLGLWSITSLLFCMVLESVLISFFYM